MGSSTSKRKACIGTTSGPSRGARAGAAVRSASRALPKRSNASASPSVGPARRRADVEARDRVLGEADVDRGRGRRPGRRGRPRARPSPGRPRGRAAEAARGTGRGGGLFWPGRHKARFGRWAQRQLQALPTCLPAGTHLRGGDRHARFRPQAGRDPTPTETTAHVPCERDQRKRPALARGTKRKRWASRAYQRWGREPGGASGPCDEFPRRCGSHPVTGSVRLTVDRLDREMSNKEAMRCLSTR
jgi:hypothetical protein